MASFNRTILVGNLTRDVEMKYTPSSLAIADITLAVSDRVKRGDKWEDETSFIDATLFGRSAEIASEYLGKGSPVLIEGKLKQDQWTDKQSGQKRSKVKVVVEKLVLVGGKGGGEPRSRNNPEPDEAYQPEPQGQGGGDDIPF